MSRRLIASLSAVLCALLAVAAVALASGGEAGSAVATSTTAATTAPATTTTAGMPGHRIGPGFGRHHGGFGLFRKLLLKSAAKRLGVEPAALQKAAEQVAADQFAKKAAEAKLTEAETAALKACRGAGHRGMRAWRHGGAAPKGCDRAAARSAITKLRALPKPDLAALKTELADALGKELGIPGARIIEAARAELSDRLDQAVKIGFLDAAGKARVLGCFDDPASCDLKALKASVMKGHLRKWGHRGAGKRGTRPATARRLKHA